MVLSRSSNENSGLGDLARLPSELLGKLLGYLSLEELNTLRSVSKWLKCRAEKTNLEMFNKIHCEVRKTRSEIEQKIMPVPSKRPSRRPRGHSLEGYLEVIKDVDNSMETVLSEYRFIKTSLRGPESLPMFFGLYIDTCHDCCAAVRRRCLSGIHEDTPAAPPDLEEDFPEHTDTKHFYKKLAKHLQKVTIPELLRHTYYSSVYSLYVNSPPSLPAQTTPLPTLEASSALEKLPPSLLDKIFEKFTLAELNLLRSVSRPLKHYAEKRNEEEVVSVYALIVKTSTELETKINPASLLRPSQRPRDHPLSAHHDLVNRLWWEMTSVWDKYTSITKTIRECPVFFGGYIDACRELCGEVRRRALEGDDVIPIPFAYDGNGGIPQEVACSDLGQMLLSHMDEELIPFYCRLNGWGIRKDYTTSGSYLTPKFYVINAATTNTTMEEGDSLKAHFTIEQIISAVGLVVLMCFLCLLFLKLK